MKTILVTGGAGFIGSHTVIELLKKGYTPVIVDNFSNSQRFIIDRLKELSGRQDLISYDSDCTDFQSLNQIFEKENISGVIHFAAFKAVGESIQFPLSYHLNNLNSMTNILKCMEVHQITDLVFSSSCTVYGNTSESPVTELSTKNEPTSPYGRSKVFCEAIIKDVQESPDTNLNTVMLRYFNPVGAHPSGMLGELPLGSPNNLVPYITQTAAGIREQLTIFGDDYDTPDGTCVRDYIHVVDVARAHVSALQWLESKENSLEAVNLGSGKGDSVLKVVQTFEKETGVKVNYKIGARRTGDIDTVYADPSKANEMFKWNTEYSLEDALSHAWKWQKGLK